MRKSRFSEEQIIGFLKEVEAGRKISAVCREHGIAEATLYRWRSKCSGLEVSDAKRLRALEEENRRLKHLVADQSLDNQALKAALRSAIIHPADRRRSLSRWASRACLAGYYLTGRANPKDGSTRKRIESMRLLKRSIQVRDALTAFRSADVAEARPPRQAGPRPRARHPRAAQRAPVHGSLVRGSLHLRSRPSGYSRRRVRPGAPPFSCPGPPSRVS